MDLFFGKKKKQEEKPLTTSGAIQKLKETISLLEKREAFLLKQNTELRNNAKEALKNKQKDKAMYNLRKAKMMEKELESLFNTKLNLEIQCDVISENTIKTEIIKAMKTGRDVLQKSENKIDPNTVDEVMDDIEENMAMVREVADSLSRPLGDPVDETALLEELKAEILEEDMISVPKILNMPNVPTHVPTSTSTKVEKVEKEDAEIKKLQEILN
jgi:charged multivesicular body protein 4